MRRASFISLLATALATAQGQASSPVRTVDRVDLQRYAGTWYEVGRLPNRFQKKCARDVKAEYRLQGDAVAVTNTCAKADGTLTTVHGKAKVVDGKSNARLKVTFFWPFYGDYWILGLDPEYRWAVVGGPDRKYLWILSRTRSLSPQQRTDALRVAEQNGYPVSSIVPTPQG